METMGKPDKDLNETMKHICDVVQKRIDEAYQKGLDDGKEYGLDESDMREAVSYQRGLDDAWEAARKISLMLPDEIEKVFPGAAKYNRYNLGYSGVEAIEKLKAYEKQKADDEIKVGDEVTHKSDSVVWKAVCIQIDGDGRHMNLMGHTGAVGYYPVDDFKKTGRHFDIEKILEAMKE